MDKTCPQEAGNAGGNGEANGSIPADAAAALAEVRAIFDRFCFPVCVSEPRAIEE